MLKQLYIKNFTLIDELDIQLFPGFSVITGETGAGKSIILGALSLLLGQRADSRSIKSGSDRCIIEAHFDLSRYQLESLFTSFDIDYDAHDCIFRRELTAAGKSRAFINDTPVPLGVMKAIGQQLVDIHSQHQNLLLQEEDFQLNVVDIIAQDGKQLASYQDAFRRYQEARRAVMRMEEDIAKAAPERRLPPLPVQRAQRCPARPRPAGRTRTGERDPQPCGRHQDRALHRRGNP